MKWLLHHNVQQLNSIKFFLFWLPCSTWSSGTRSGIRSEQQFWPHRSCGNATSLNLLHPARDWTCILALQRCCWSHRTTVGTPRSQSFSGLESLGFKLQICSIAFFSPLGETGSLEGAGLLIALPPDGIRLCNICSHGKYFGEGSDHIYQGLFFSFPCQSQEGTILRFSLW